MVIEDHRRRHEALSGASTAGARLEVVTILREDGTELAIHAMAMRPKYRLLLRR